MNNGNLCDKERLSALLDGELTDAERDAALAHLDECETCRTYFAELAAMREALSDMEEIDAPEGFAESVLARLHEPTAPKTAKRFAFRRGYAALAACAAVVVLAAAMLPNAFRMGSAADQNTSTPAAAPGAAAAENSLMTTMTMGTEPGEEAVCAAEQDTAFAADSKAAAETSESVGSTVTANATAPVEPVEPTVPVEPVEPAARENGENGENGENVTDAGSGENDSQEYTVAPTEEAEASETMTLCGDGAEDWLRVHGTLDEEDGSYSVEVEVLVDLPEDLTLSGVMKSVNGLVQIIVGETEEGR